MSGVVELVLVASIGAGLVVPVEVIEGGGIELGSWCQGSGRGSLCEWGLVA